ncbi:MAG: hypothetical protein ABL984_01170 [Pyrinomonadaceae bacterium]
MIDTPYYRTRIERLWLEPIFVYTSAPPIYYERIKIKSPNNGLHLGQIYGRPMKPTKAQIDFRRGNAGKPMKAKKDKGENAPGQGGLPPGQAKKSNDGPVSDKGRDNPSGPPKADKPGKPDNPGGGQNMGGDKGKGNDKGHDQHKDGGQGKGGGKGKGKP